MPETDAPPEQGQQGRPSHEEEGRSPWFGLAVVLVGAFMAVLDTTIVNVALPSIGKGIHATSAGLEWVVSGYALTFGLALIPAGRVGDRIGTKPLLLGGLVTFIVASLACGLAGTPAELVVARLVQGLGAGVYYPAISATIQRSFSGRDRSRAFGALGGVVGISTAVGPLLGGALIALAGPDTGWRLVFLVNVGIGAVAVPAAALLLPRRHERTDHQLDPVGNALLLAVLLLVLLPLVEGRAAGWPVWSFVALAAVGPAVVVLARWEHRLYRRGGEPVLRPDLLSHRSFAGGQVLAVLYFAGFTSLFFVLSILWQEGLGRSALDAGLLVLPFAVGSLLTASNSDRFSSRLGRRTITLGTTAMAVGQLAVLVALAVQGRHPAALPLLPGLALAGLGNGLVIAPNQDFVLGSVPQREAATAGGALITAQRIGAAIGIAVIGTALFGTGSSSSTKSGGNVALVGAARVAIGIDVAFVAAALACTWLLPRQPAEERADENR